MKCYCPVQDDAIGLAQDQMYDYIGWLRDENYDPDGIKISLSIKRVGDRYEITIK